MICGSLLDVFHPEGHVGAIEIRAKTNVVNPRHLDRVVDVLDDFGPVHSWQVAAQNVFPGDAIAFDQLAPFSIPASLLNFQRDCFVPFRMRFLRVPELLARESRRDN